MRELISLGEVWRFGAGPGDTDRLTHKAGKFIDAAENIHRLVPTVSVLEASEPAPIIMGAAAKLRPKQSQPITAVFTT